MLPGKSWPGALWIAQALDHVCLDSRLVFFFLPVIGAAVPDFDLATASGTVLLAATVFFLPAFGFLALRLLLF